MKSALDDASLKKTASPGPIATMTGPAPNGAVGPIVVPNVKVETYSEPSTPSTPSDRSALVRQSGLVDIRVTVLRKVGNQAASCVRRNIY